MTYHTRAAIAAIAALALGACVTTETTSATNPLVSEISAPDLSVKDMPSVKMPGAEVPMTGIKDSAETAFDGETGADAGAQDTEMQETETSKENLLYGVMTKYELMSFLEAINAADMQSALEGEAPVTVFAPNNQAFEYASLADDADMPAILKGHIVDGAMDVAALKAAVAENGAPVELTSSAGTKLTVYVMDDKVKVAGPSGALATITQGDMRQSNGVMHQVSSVFLPK